MEISHRPTNDLIEACQTGHLDRVRALIRPGAYVNAVGKDGNTPLHLASLGGHTEIVKALIQAGADVNAVDVYGKTALYYASCYGHAAIVKILVEAKDDTASRGPSEIVETFGKIDIRE